MSYSPTDRIDGVIPQTAAESLAACDKQAFSLIHVMFLSVLLTLSVSTASVENLNLNRRLLSLRIYGAVNK